MYNFKIMLILRKYKQWLLILHFSPLRMEYEGMYEGERRSSNILEKFPNYNLAKC